jgi:hypothetical protein
MEKHIVSIDVKTEVVDVLSPINEGGELVVKPKGKGGRPKKSALLEKTKRPKRGRPIGEAGRIREFHARLLATTGDKVIETIIRKALSDEDKDQVACLKMCVDRLLPISYFEKEKGSGRNAINITISGIGGSTVIESEDLSEEYDDVDFKDESNGSTD